MTKVVIMCSAGDIEATLIFQSTLGGAWTWACAEGVNVWGGAGKGTTPSALLAPGVDTIQLNSTDYLYGVENLKIGSSGKGERLSNYGGTFPAGEFAWECTEL